MGAIGLLEWMILSGALGIIFGCVYSIIDILRHKFVDNGQIVWLLVVLLVPFGFLLYLTIGRGKRVGV